MNTKFEILKLTQMSLFIAIALCLMLLIRIPLIPSAPYLIYDLADIVIIISNFIFGTIPAITISLIVYLIEAFSLTADTWIGFTMDFVFSSIVILVLSAFKVPKKNLFMNIIAIIIATLSTTLAMIPLNYIFQTKFYSIPDEVICGIIFTVIIPFNMIKSMLNCSIAIFTFDFIKPVLTKIKIHNKK